MELFKRGIACLLFIGVFTFGQLNAQCVKPSFVQTVTVTNPNVATLTDYVVKLTINTSALQAGGKLSNKFGFVFYDSDCNTQLNYWPSDVDPFPSVTASYYVRIPSIPGSSSKLITMHYDNATTCSQLIGNTFSVIGSVAAAPTVGFSAATTWEMSNYTFPTNATTFRWDVRSANTGTFKPKTSYTIATAQYVQAEGSNKTVAIGTNFYVDELPVDAGGHPSFFTPTLLTIGQNCGLCQSVKSGSGDIPPNTAPLTANSSNTAQVRIYYRKRAAAEPTTSNGAEFDLTTPVTITPAGPVVACEEDILQFTASTPFIKYNWYLDNVLLSSGAATTQAINTSGFPSGIRVLKVVAYKTECDSVQSTKNITINPRPDINSLLPDNGCQLADLNFSANIGLNGSTLTNFDWDFGDGNTGTGATPVHNYAIAANLNLRLIVTTNLACKDTLVEPIEVYPKPTINTVTETDICWPNAVAYDNNSSISSNWNGSTLVSFDWDYGDGNTGTGTTSSHAFALPNQYAETLVVTTNVGCKDTLSGSVDVWPKPDINSISDLDICWPQAASFSNVSTVPNNWNMASIVDFDWHFGDGTTGLGGSTTHAYSIPNLYNDSLIVITSDMCRDTFAETISIWPKPAIDSVTVLDQCWPNGTNFQGYHSIANNWNSAAVTIYDWDFGDANSGNTNPIFHVYTLPNVYTHELIVETGNACRDTLVDQVNIWPKPSINSITEIDICWPNAVDFSNNTTIPVNWNMATIAQWDWRFGDGNTGNTPTLQHNYLIPNRYFDTLYVRTTDDCRDTLTGSVDVWPKPSIDSILVQDVCEPEIVNFSVAAQILNNWDNATFSQYLWNFGDGNTATGASTTHQYATAGAYLVTLIVVTSDACSDTLTKTVNVYPKPSSNYTIADICYGDSLFLNSTSSVSNVLGTFIANHFWTFGDGDSSQVVNPAHFYNFDGLYTVTLVTTTNHNCKDTLIQPVNVYPKPNASFTFPRTCQPDAVAFADASTLSSGTISNYDWDFGDGGSSTMQNPSYAYAAADSYFVELIVTTDQGCLDTLLKALVWNPKPSADFDFQNICFPDSMYFNDLTTLQFGNLLRWEWDFGDGNSSLATNPVHAYTTAGSYSVQLIVTTDSLCMDTLVQTVYSNEKPQAAYSPSTICWPDTVPFQDQSTIGGTAQVVGWSWQFGDGDTSSLQNPMHYYAHPDTFNLTFIAFSDSGCTDTLANRFVAFPPPGLQIGPDTLWLCPFNTVDLHAGPQFVNYTWQDGSTDSLFIVNTPGVYWVTVTDTNGCMQSDTVETPLAPKPVLNVDPGDSVAFCTGSSIVVDAVTPTIQSFQWSTGATSSEIEIDQAGTYTVIGWNEYVCSDTVDVVVVENPLPIPDLGPDLSICAGDTSLLNPGTFQSYAWSNGAVDQEIKVWYSGVFAVTVTDNNLCEAADTIQVVRHELPQVNLGPDSSLCAGDAMIFDAGAGFVSYFWSPSGEVSQSITVDSQDSVSVIVTDVFGCVNISNVVWVSVDPLPAVPTITKGDDEIELVSSVEANYQWLLGGNNLSGSILQFHIPTESGDYQVIVTDTNGCSMISEIFFISLDIFDEEMFQGISPNGDGVNDRFTVPEIEYYPENTIQIFNRWGTIVFDKKGYLNEFVGRDGKGNELPDGTYFYVLDLGNGQKPVKGYFVINR